MRSLPVLLSLCLILSCNSKEKAATESPQEANYLEETPEEREARMQWWRDARFGMFIHSMLALLLRGRSHSPA